MILAQLNHYYSILLHTIYGKLRGKYAAKYEQKVKDMSKECIPVKADRVH